MTTLMVTCAIVWPLPNRALVLQSNGQHYWVSYKDNGDHIVYSRGHTKLVERLVEHRKGTAPRVGCESFQHPTKGYF